MKILTTPLELVRAGQQVTGDTQQAGGQNGVGFGEFLKNAIDEVNAMDKQSAAMKTQLLTGQIDDIHQVMIAAEKANMAFQLTVQIRNKVVEAYQEIMRMQV